MKQKMKATYRIEKTVHSGERYVCDQCAEIFFDSTQYEDTVHYRSLPPIRHFCVKMKVSTDAKNLHACSQECVKKMFEIWQSEEMRFTQEHPDLDSGGNFEVYQRTIYPENVLNDYKPNDLPIDEWNKLKKEESILSRD